MGSVRGRVGNVAANTAQLGHRIHRHNDKALYDSV